MRCTEDYCCIDIAHLAIEKVHEDSLDLGYPRRPPHQHHLVYTGLVELRVAQYFVHRLETALEKVEAQCLQLGPGEGEGKVYPVDNAG